MARPTKMTPEVVGKLEEAFSLGADVTKACSYADISRDTYYKWVKDKPELSDRFDRLRDTPILLALKTVVRGIEDSPTLAMKYLERKWRDEFGNIDKPEESEKLEKVTIEIIDSRDKVDDE